MTILDAIILGIVEGITEYLPVSSTGHLVLASSLLGLDQGESARSVNALMIIIQGGAILAVLGLYRNRVASMIKGLFGKDQQGLKLLINICIAFAPAAVLGVLLDDWIEQHLFHAIPVLIALGAGGILMIWIGRGPKSLQSRESADSPGMDLADLAPAAALFIGSMQLLAMWPGVSRSMITIVAAMLVGLRPARAAEFSFLLGLPTLGGACVYKLLKNVTSDQPNLFVELGWLNVLVGIIVATIAAAIAVKWLVSYLNKHGLAVFGWYRIGLTILLAALLMTGVITLEPAGAS
ncbi:MAG: UDP-diphosphatase [Phycisphaerae bacterium]|nr:UDP-diphosphatase [Phycisphaerae bacterium]|tara:strand:- start:353 stop:1231 length:879 start_codon:yes stop_codon:yes gene_type:complete